MEWSEKNTHEILSMRGDILLRRGSSQFVLQGGGYVLHASTALHLADGSVTDVSVQKLPGAYVVLLYVLSTQNKSCLVLSCLVSFIQRKHPISTESGDYFISIFTLHFLIISEIGLFHCPDISLYLVGICLYIL